MQQLVGLEDKGQPDDSLVLEQLDRVLTSPQFTGNERRRAFLRYVIEETLAGRADRLKGYAIAVSVLGRDESFDSTTDPVVRLEARRLRRELEHYYLTDGLSDPLIITIPKGSYVPAFETRSVAEPAADDDGSASHPAPANARKPRSRAGIVVAVAAGVALAIGGTFVLYGMLDTRVETPVAKSGAAWSGLPVVAVVPFEALGDSIFAKRAASGLAEDVVTDLTRVQGLRVIAHTSTSRLNGQTLAADELGAKLGASHVLRGSLQVMKDGYRLNASIVEVASRQQIWA